MPLEHLVLVPVSHTCQECIVAGVLAVTVCVLTKDCQLTLQCCVMLVLVGNDIGQIPLIIVDIGVPYYCS